MIIKLKYFKRMRVDAQIHRILYTNNYIEYSEKLKSI